MLIKIKKRYLIFPVNTLVSNKELSFKSDNETLYKLNIKLDNINPDFYAYIDMARFIGQELDLSVAPETEIKFRESDTMDIKNLYKEPHRPQVHFTPKNGWMNDPNGLIYLNGVYHMFFQYNPAEPNWANMHWGHAISEDLIHWEEKDIALFPDNRGAMFSGSAIYDSKKLLGDNTAALFYTTTEPYCQYMSYSDDDFKTLKNFDNKPVVPHIAGENRDPKVIFCDELNCYIMALYLENDEYCILSSDNLTDWKELQRISIYGDNECPDIFPLTTDDGDRKWILIGAHDKYLVGEFINGKFIPCQSEISLHYGPSGYAGQTFNNLPNGRIVRIVWDRWQLPAFNIKGQMGIPVEMSLCKHEDLYYLCANPVVEIEQLFCNTEIYSNVLLSPENYFTSSLKDTAQLIKIKSDLPHMGNMEISVFGRSIKLDFEKNTMCIGETIAPITATHNDLDLTLLVDRCSIEIYADNGKVLMSVLDEHTFMDRNIAHLDIKSDTAVTIKNIEINSLDSIWGD